MSKTDDDDDDNEWRESSKGKWDKMARNMVDESV